MLRELVIESGMFPSPPGKVQKNCEVNFHESSAWHIFSAQVPDNAERWSQPIAARKLKSHASVMSTNTTTMNRTGISSSPLVLSPSMEIDSQESLRIACSNMLQPVNPSKSSVDRVARCHGQMTHNQR